MQDFIKKNIKILLPVILGIFLLIITASIFLRKTGTKDTVIEAVSVSWKYPHRGEIFEELVFTGNIEAAQMVKVTPKAQGTILDIKVEVGEQVEKGDVIAEIEKNASLYTLQQAQGAYNAAKATYNKAVKGARQTEINMVVESVNQAKAMYDSALEEYNRIKKLYDEQIVTKSDYDKVKAQLDVYKSQYTAAQNKLETVKSGATQEEIAMARAQMEAAAAQLRLATLNYENTTITSPISGIVALMHVEKGQVVGSTVPICTITDIDKVKIKVKIPEKYYSYTQEHKDDIVYYVQPVSYPDSRFEAYITLISPFVSPENRTFWVELSIDNEDHMLTYGMFSEVTAVFNKKENALLLPLEAIDNDGEIWVLNGDGVSASKRTVNIGIKNDDYAEVVSGITENEKVIVEGNNFIDEHSVLKVIEGH